MGIADVIRAWRMLEASTDEERRAIARLLGFELRGVDSTPAPLVANCWAAPSAAPAIPPLTEAPLKPPAHGDGSLAQPIELTPFVEARDNPASERLALSAIERPHRTRAAPLGPLFRTNWTRALASTLSARSAEVGALHVRRAVDLLLSRRPITNLPRLPRLVSTTEVVAIVDRGGSMAWFRADAEQVITRLDAVTRANVMVLEADGAPPLAAVATSSPPGDDDGFRPPALRMAEGGRALAFTDLGLGNTWGPPSFARADAWFELAAALRSRGASLVIVTPVPIARIPARLRRRAACVHWDRSTRPARVCQLIKRIP